MGPAQVTKGTGLDIGPHPHAGLQTVTYLFNGEALHHDSLGTVQLIKPGQLNLMTAGTGVSRTPKRPPASTIFDLIDHKPSMERNEFQNLLDSLAVMSPRQIARLKDVLQGIENQHGLIKEPKARMH